jgi:CubicO group peptidase (beta-lactamase class C family)
MKASPTLLALALLCGCASPPTRPNDIERGDEETVKAYLTQFIAYEMTKSATPGLSIAVVDDQRIVWAQGFGFADVERKLPATAQTLYRVGSISKLFTDTAAMQLFEQRRLDIDRPLQTALPDFSIRQREPTASAITPRQLMTHHAGLPRDRLKGFMTSEPEPFTSVIEPLRDESAYAPPGQLFAYSNLGITLLGAAIQRVSGTPFAEHLKHALLMPLGMPNSSFETGVSPSPLMASAYRGHERGVEARLRDVPAGGLNSSVDEMSHFISMVLARGVWGTHRILKPETVDEMLRPQNAKVALDLNFHVGLGWMLSTLGRSTIRGGGVVAHHAGATHLFCSQIYLLPEHKLGVIVLANSSTATQNVDRIASTALALALESKTGIKQPPFVTSPPAAQPAPDATLDALVGDYTTIVGLVRVWREGRRLQADLGGRNFDLVPRSDGTFALDYKLLGILRIGLGPLDDVGLSLQRVGGREVLVARIGSQEMLAGEKVVPPPALSAAWQRRLGDYEITNLGGDRRLIQRVRLAQHRGFLVAELTTPEAPDEPLRTALMPRSDTEALALGVLADAGETLRVETVDGAERLVMSGYEARRVAP